MDLEIKSLLYFCFGFTIDDDADTILKCIVEKAYNDATMQGAFNALLSDKSMKDMAKDVKAYVIDMLLDKLTDDRIKSADIKNQAGYDTWHKGICKAIMDKYEKKKIGDDLFSYGNAQKILNMTMKYLYMLYKIEKGGGITEITPSVLSEMFEGKKNISKFLHVPIDSYIIDAVWKDTKIGLPLKEKTKSNGENKKADRENKKYKRPSDYVLGWSKWDKDTYTGVQDGLREHIEKQGICPIEWEEERWIEISKDRRAG